MKNSIAEINLIFVTLLFLSLLSCTEKNEVYKIETFKTDNGWGYLIKVNNKDFIRQKRIPAIEGNVPFQSEEDAKKVGVLMINKLKKKKMPSISIEELLKAKIKIPEKI